ncbi:MAG: hypothetical protein AUJ20_11600 [Comamonadaceae bacterium CG1_02_60_18]|nr:MAG: hypothetical protein AUJ20_11600 [Comamonadaceae bacterium CG1_02_60_18]PIQ55495.1 MAG: hypothetical protein COW02_02630 [Comamonadaceae bacterium CG12_big_fil_rev_8_21_14_0_65_59_15]
MTAAPATDSTAPQDVVPGQVGEPAAPQASDAVRASSVLPRAGLVVLAVLATVALVTTLLLWQKVVNMQEQLARQSAEAQSVSLEARAMARQAVEVTQQTTARAAVLEARLGEVALQRSQLDELMQSLSRSRDENLVVDIEAALRLAQQQAQLTGSVEPLLASLKSAEQRVARAAQPRLGLLQRALARDIDRVKSASVSDTPSMLVKLDELVRLTDDLALANAAQPVRSRTEKPRAAASVPQKAWQSLLGMALNEARNLVRVSEITAPEAVLLSPQQSFFLRENLKLTLLNARLTLLSRQMEAARADLRSAEEMLKKYFDAQSRKTQTALALLQQLQQQTRNLQLPRVDDTLAVLATAAAGR